MYTFLEESAKRACLEMGGHPDNWIALATQMIQEKGYPWWENPQPPFNVGNVKVVHGGQLEWGNYPTLDAGVDGYVHTFTYDPAGYYTDVLHAIRNGTPDDVIEALSKSPFCDPPYPLYELRSILDHLEMVFGIQAHNHPNYPNATPTHAPTQSGEEFITVTPWPTAHSTLWGIASDPHVFGNGNDWRELLPLNPGLNPSEIHAGQRIRIK